MIHSATAPTAPPKRRWQHGDPPAPGTPRIVCCPHSGGSATYFRPWSSAVPDGVALVPVQYPGRHERLAEPFAESVEQIADALATELLADVAEGPGDTPVVLFGHSMGASVAFETARRVSGAGATLCGLIVSAHVAPTVPVTSTVHELPDDQMWQALAEWGGTETEVLDLPELRKLFTPAIRADLTISAAYVDPAANGSLDVPVIALAGESDSIAPTSDMHEWADVTTGGFAMRTFPGDHFYLVDYVEDILRIASDVLQAAHSDSP
ncbi:alpha/beta fold hydrolase [Solicola gregarius]|uniref:Alpha/beta fold hydrolase n=1 Tax=Solicola gregarius TaxID=2908642 RepID=A0AA46TEB5_9ACTN|nr:alpha/beta fold hydrolase [Solicola gregarius]UYM03655.1 alpha/beta fold hydrolase [Solicola gregarius]